MFLPPHISMPWTKLLIYTITDARPDQLNLSVVLYGQSRSLYPISQLTEQTCHYINSVTEEHFFTSGALDAYPVTLPRNDSKKPKNHTFLRRTWHAGWEENTACHLGLINAHQPHSLHTDEESRIKRKCLCSQRTQ